MTSKIIIYCTLLINFCAVQVATDLFPNMAAHPSHAEKLHSLRADLVKQKMRRLEFKNQGMLICLFVTERDIHEPNHLELTVSKQGKRDHIIPIHEVELYDVFDTATRKKEGTVLSVFYEKIPLKVGSYDLQVDGEKVKFYKDTRIDPGRVTIITHLDNNKANTEPHNKLLEFYKAILYRYLQRYETHMHNINYELEKPGLQHLVIDLTLDYNESSHRPITKIAVSKAGLVNSISETIDSIDKTGYALQYAGTQTIKAYERETTHSHYLLGFRFHRLPAVPANKCLNMVLDASLLRQDVQQTQSLALGRNGKITLYDVFCSKEELRQKFSHTRLEVVAQRQREGVWKIIRNVRLTR